MSGCSALLPNTPFAIDGASRLISLAMSCCICWIPPRCGLVAIEVTAQPAEPATNAPGEQAAQDQPDRDQPPHQRHCRPRDPPRLRGANPGGGTPPCGASGTPPAGSVPPGCCAPPTTCWYGGGPTPAPFGAAASAPRSGTPPMPGPPPSNTPGCGCAPAGELPASPCCGTPNCARAIACCASWSMSPRPANANTSLYSHFLYASLWRISSRAILRRISSGLSPMYETASSLPQVPPASRSCA